MDLTRREWFGALVAAGFASKIPLATGATALGVPLRKDDECFVYKFNEDDDWVMNSADPAGPFGDCFGSFYPSAAIPRERFIEMQLNNYSGHEAFPFQHQQFDVHVSFRDKTTITLRIAPSSTWRNGKSAGFKGRLAVKPALEPFEFLIA